LIPFKADFLLSGVDSGRNAAKKFFYSEFFYEGGFLTLQVVTFIPERNAA
jgi:hypothetical protein